MSFDSATAPNAFWVPPAEMNFKEDAPIMKGPVAGGKVYSGDASSDFEKVDAPFKFLSP